MILCVWSLSFAGWERGGRRVRPAADTVAAVEASHHADTVLFDSSGRAVRKPGERRWEFVIEPCLQLVFHKQGWYERSVFPAFVGRLGFWFDRHRILLEFGGSTPDRGELSVATEPGSSPDDFDGIGWFVDYASVGVLWDFAVLQLGQVFEVRVGLALGYFGLSGAYNLTTNEHGMTTRWGLLSPRVGCGLAGGRLGVFVTGGLHSAPSVLPTAEVSVHVAL